MDFRGLALVAVAFALVGCGGGSEADDQRGDEVSGSPSRDVRYLPLEDLISSRVSDVALQLDDLPDGWTRKRTGRGFTLCPQEQITLSMQLAGQVVFARHFEDPGDLLAVSQRLLVVEDGARWMATYREIVGGCSTWTSYAPEFDAEITSTLDLRDFGPYGDETVGLGIRQTGLPNFDTAFVDVSVSRHGDVIHILMFTSLGTGPDNGLRDATIATAEHRLLNPRGIDLLVEP